MALTIPNSAAAAFPVQAEPDAVDVDIIVAALSGVGVVSGCAVTAQGIPDMTVAVAAGVIQSSGARIAVTAGNVTITAADAANPRFDLIVADSAGAKQLRGGTAAASPVFPSLAAGDVALAAVYVPANDTAINTNQLVDKRMILTVPDTIARVAVTSAITLTEAHRTVLASAATAAFTITLPTAVGCAGRRYVIKKTDVGLNAVTVDAAGSETIDGALTFVIDVQYESVEIESDGANWWVI